MEEEETELRNPFPSPPSHYTKYTAHNLHLLDLLQERAGDADLATLNQYEVLKDKTDVPDWPLVQLEKPRVDWVLEEGHYTVFGDTWFVRASANRDNAYTHMIIPIIGQRDYPITCRTRWPPTIPSGP